MSDRGLTFMRIGARYSFAVGRGLAEPMRRKTQARPLKNQPGHHRRRATRWLFSDSSCHALTAYLREHAARQGR